MVEIKYYIMYILIGLVYMFAVTGFYRIVDAVTTYAAPETCDRTIQIGSNIFSVLIDLSHPIKRLNVYTKFSCTFRIETSSRSLIAMKFISPSNSTSSSFSTSLSFSTSPSNSTSPSFSTSPSNSTSPSFSTSPSNSTSPSFSTSPSKSTSPSNRTDELTQRCISRVTITSAQLNVKHCNSYPKTELLSYDYVDVKYEIRRIHVSYHDSKPFKLLVFTYSYPDRFGKCQNNQILCSETGRCIHGSLKCSNVSDFCDNSMKNCQNQTHIKRSNIREASFSGVYIFLSCLIFLLGITFYMCFCQEIHLSECLCHCCSILEKTGNEHFRRNGIDRDLTSRENGNEGINTIVTSTDNSNGDENVRNNDDLRDNESSTDTSESVIFGLPPSYSCIVMSDTRDNSDILHGDNQTETNRDSVPTVSADLPPSYSTVLGHEEEYNVHVIH